jgi:hypothetical protein
MPIAELWETPAGLHNCDFSESFIHIPSHEKILLMVRQKVRETYIYTYIYNKYNIYIILKGVRSGNLNKRIKIKEIHSYIITLKANTWV